MFDTFVFPPHIQEGIMRGAYEIVRSKSGVLLSMVRDKATGQIVGHAVGTVSQSFLAVPNILLTAGQMVQTHRGFQKTYRMLESIQNNLNVLQATTEVIGVGVAATFALSYVNLRQTLKLREDIKQLRLEVKDGFVNMEKSMQSLEKNIIEAIRAAKSDLIFTQHRNILEVAYGNFLGAVKQVRASLHVEDVQTRNMNLANAIQTLNTALAAYNNPLILSDNSVPGYLRRRECAWTIEQAIAMTYQLQGAPLAAKETLSNLRKEMRQELSAAVDRCQTQAELDFIFPEITRICEQDLPLLHTWESQIEWMQSLSENEQQEISQIVSSSDGQEFQTPVTPVEAPEEETRYQAFKQKSHYDSLTAQLKFLIDPANRQPYEAYISQQAPAQGLYALVPSNWQEIPDLTVANLYHYLKSREKVQA